MNRRFTILLIFMAVGVYVNTLLNDFVAGDRQFILRNPLLGDPQAVLKSFTSDYWSILGGQSFIYYRPLTVLTHFIDSKLYGLYPLGHHLSNIIFHTIVTLLVYRLFIGLLPSEPLAAFLGGTIFTLHPIHTHSVAYIMGRTDILAAVFYIGGFILLLKGQTKTWRIAVACLCYFFALLCKEVAITLPAIFLVFRFCWVSGKQPWGKDFWRPFSLLCLTAILYLLLRSLAIGITTPEGIFSHWYTGWQRLSLIFITSGFYIWKLFFPLNLCYYSNIVIPGTWAEVFTSFFFLLGCILFISCLWALKKEPQLGFALAWIGCSLLPVLNIIPLPVIAKENYLYIPSIGFCLVFPIMITNQGRKTKAFLLYFIIPSIALLYGAITLRRNNDYRDPETFLYSTLHAMHPIPLANREDVRFFEGTKNFYITHRNLGRLYMERKSWYKASQAFEEAQSYTPAYFPQEYIADIKESLGSAYQKTGELKKASEVLNEVLPMTSRPYFVKNLLGVISMELNDVEKAESYFKQAITSLQNYAPAHYNLGILYMKHNKVQQGYEELQKAARIDPKYRKFLPHSGLPPNKETEY